MEVSFPLITYTPRYHAVNCDIKHLKNQPWYGKFKDIIEVNFELKWPGSSERIGRLGTYKVNLFINDEDISQEIIDNFYIIFGGVAFYNQGQGGWPIMRTVFLIDNYGNKYEMQSSLAPGQSFPQLGVPYNTTEYMNFYAAPFGRGNVLIDGLSPKPKRKQLPDVFIDYIVKNEMRYYSTNYKPQHYAQNTSVEFISVKPMTDIIPHREFNFDTETAKYIESLENPSPVIPKNTASINIQTNFVGVNKDLQTNQLQNNTRRNNKGRRGFVNLLRKTCGEKGCNVESEEIQTNTFQEVTNEGIQTNNRKNNRRRFTNTLRQKCKGKNCNKQNMAMQTQSAFIGRRHSMVNNLRKKVQSTRPE